MVFGSCCILKNDKLTNMQAKSVQIEGTQLGLIVGFEVTQTFYHSEESPKEVSYVFPNDLKICIYDTTFVVGEEVIKPKLESKEEAQKTYKEAVESGHTAVYGSCIGYNLAQFKLGNVPPKVECKVILKIAFTAQLTNERTFYIKFPLDVCTPSGSVGCLDVNSSEFSFQIQSEKDKIKQIVSNVKNGQFDSETKIFKIDEKVENDQNEHSIILTFETIENINSSALLMPKSDSSNYNCCALTISPNLPISEESNSEFVFVVDCSGSMGGISIKKAAECLEFFIKSLPQESFFNVIRFGSRFEKLFEQSVEYTEENAEKAIDLAQKLSSDLGGTDIYNPLASIFKEENLHGQRQIFVMTDGEVFNLPAILQLIRENSDKNRCFSIGIGRGCDAGLVEGMANASGGKSDFVQNNDNISEKVIPQLKSSLHPLLDSIEIHIENNDSFEISPFPISPINANGASIVFLRTAEKEFGSILINGNYGNQNVEFQIDEIMTLDEEETIGKAILPLFSFNILKQTEQKQSVSDEEKRKAIELSISSGVLCKFTGFIGVTQNVLPHFDSYFATHPIKLYKKSYGRRSTGGCTPRKSLGAKAARKSTGGCTPRKSLGAKAARKSTPVLENTKTKQSNHADENDKMKNKYDLLALTRYQKISGFWNDLEAVNKMLGLNIQHIDDIKLSDEKLEKNCVATIMAIAAMRVKSSYEKDSWILMEQKAIAWLKRKLFNVDIEKVIAKIEKLIY